MRNTKRRAAASEGCTRGGRSAAGRRGQKGGVSVCENTNPRIMSAVQPQGKEERLTFAESRRLKLLSGPGSFVQVSGSLFSSGAVPAMGSLP